MREGRKKIQNRRGFTMLEVVVVIAVVVVLLAIAVPGIISLRLSLKMTELDALARQIFISSQNNLISMKSQGSLDLLSGIEIQTKPSDFDSTGLVWGDEEYLYVESGTSFAQVILPEKSMEKQMTLTEGKYVIEFCKETASVYGVFYTDAPAGFAYSAIASPSRDRDTRKDSKPLVGYYGGAGIDSADLMRTDLPEFAVTNDETLSVSLIPKAQTAYTVRIASATFPELYKEFSFSGDAPGEAESYGNVSYDGGTGRVNVLLDSLGEGRHFADIFAVSDGEDRTPITPGDNLIVSVTATYSDGERIFFPSVATERTNSLFAGRTGGDVNVSSCRHLQNLEPTVSNLGFEYEPTGILKVAPPISDVRQTAAINWLSMSGTGVTGFAGSPLRSAPEGKLVSIAGAPLASYNGGGLAISGLDFAANGGFAGLFGSADGMSFTGVVLINPVMSVSANYAGFLVGKASGCDFDSCRVFTDGARDVSLHGIGISALSADSDRYAGGLVGLCENSSVDDCCASAAFINADDSSSGSVYLGGLIGKAYNVDISSSFADVCLFAGEGAQTMFLSGISSAVSSTFAGGFAGVLESDAGSTVSDSYCAGNISAPGGTVGGFAGTVSGVSVSSCYSAAMFEGAGNSAVSSGFAGALTGAVFADCRYIKQSSPKAGDAQGIEELSYGELHMLKPGAKWSSASVSTTVPLASVGAYPFPRLISFAHYGDWPLETDDSIDCLLVYYEKYSNNNYSYFAHDVELSSALVNGTDVIEDGYALLLGSREYNAMTDKTLPVVYGGALMQTLTVLKSGSNPVTITADGGTYYIYLIRPTYAPITEGAPIVPGGFYYPLSVLGKQFRFNPNFAKTAVNNFDEEEGEPAEPSSVVVRTARQLAALGTHGDYWDMSFVQERNIDFSAYTAVSCEITPIGGGTAFSGVYNGGSRIITGAGIDSQAENVGLFGVTSSGAQLKNIIFISELDEDLARSVSGTGNVGALVGSNGGSVTNCAVAGFAVSGAETGGLVGVNEKNATITKSSSSCVYFTSYVTSGGSVTGTGKLGGFVGRNKGDISSCYASARLSSASAGGFVGHSSGNIRASYCVSVNSEGEYLTFTENGGKLDGCWSLANVSNAHRNQVTYYELANLSSSLGTSNGWNKITAADASFRYSNRISANIYPFPAVVTRSGARVHYGNWPLDDLSTVEMAYYEIYRESNGRYTMKLYNESLGLTQLDDDKRVMCDGYVILFEKDPGAATSAGVPYADLTNVNKVYQEWVRSGTVNKRNYLKKPTEFTDGNATVRVYYNNIALSSTAGADTVTIGASQYYPRFLASANVVADNYNDPDFYQDMTISARTTVDGVAAIRERQFYYNPHFAKSVISIGERPADAQGNLIMPEEVYIRTERHLATLATRTYYASLWSKNHTFVQERNLVFGDNNPYTTNYITTAMESFARNSLDSMGSGSANFIGVYDGRGNSISGLAYSPSAGSAGAGLFGVASNLTIRNLTLEAPNVNTGRRTNVSAVGALVGQGSNLTIENVTVNSPVLYGSNMVGGAVGKLYGDSVVTDLTIDGGSVRAARQAGGAFGRISNEEDGSSDGVSVNGANIRNIAVTSTEEVEPANIASSAQRKDGFGTGGFVGTCVINTRRSGGITLSDISVNDAVITVESMSNIAEHNNNPAMHFHAGGAIIGNFFASTSAAPFSISGCEAVNSTLNGIGSGQNSSYGMIIGNVNSCCALNLSGVSQRLCTLSRAGAEDEPGTAVGGFVGRIIGEGAANTSGEAISESNKLRIMLPSGTVETASIVNPASAVRSDIGGVIGVVGSNVFINSIRTFATTVSEPEISDDGGSAGGFVGALFGYISNASVDNATIRGMSGGTTGGFVGAIYNGQTENCDVRLSDSVRRGDVPPEYAVIGTGFTGGFAGAVSGSEAVAISCFAAVPVSGESDTGGFAGVLESGRLESCYASGNVSGGAGGNTGGLVGHSRTTDHEEVNSISLIVTCYASGDVNSAAADDTYTGGFIGYSSACSLMSCYSLGKVTVGNEQAADGGTGGFIGHGEGLTWNPSNTVTSTRVLATMATFYNVLQTTKVTNRYDSQPALNPDGTWDYTNCRSVITYIRDSRITVDSNVQGAYVDGRREPDGTIASMGNSGAISKNVLDRMENYPELQVGTWAAQWDAAENDVVVLWCTSAVTAADNRSTVEVYRYVSKRNEYTVGTTTVGVKSEFGGRYAVLEFPGTFVEPPEIMPGTTAVNGCFLYSDSNNYNYNVVANSPSLAYSDYNYDGIDRWLSSELIADAARLTSTETARKVFGNMKVSNSSYPYQNALTYFPYPTLSMVGCSVGDAVHWGDWPSVVPLSGVAYYEKYSDGSAGVYCVGTHGSLDTLSDSPDVSEYGYVQFKNANSDVTINAVRRTDIAVDGYEFYRLSSSNVVNGLSYCVVNGVSYVYNVDFAKAIELRNDRITATLGRTTPYAIRTEEQFENLNKELLVDTGGTSPYYLTLNFRQERDLSFDSADFAAGSQAQPFDGSYDGGGFEVEVSADVSDAGAIGLFAASSGAVANVNVRSSLRLVEPDAQLIAGAIAGINTGNITNCRASLTVDSVSSGAIIGGIVGENSGSITLCHSVCDISGSAAALGGLAGTVTVDGSISRCYAKGTLSGSADCAGGAVGASAGLIEDCYSTVEVDLSPGAASLHGQFCGALTGAGIARNCYALGDGSLPFAAFIESTDVTIATLVNCYFRMADGRYAGAEGSDVENASPTDTLPAERLNNGERSVWMDRLGLPRPILTDNREEES